MGLLIDDAAVPHNAAAALFSSASPAAAPAAKRKRKAAEDGAQASGGEHRSDDNGSTSARSRADPEVDDEKPAPAVAGDQKRVGEKPKGRTKPDANKPEGEDPERLARTVFVGNVPIETDRHKVERHFAGFGKVESVRIRSVAAANPKMPQKAAVIKKELDASVKASVNAYVVFEAAEHAAAALASNGAVAFGRHLRIDAASKAGTSAGAAGKFEGGNRCVFLGNLPFDTQEEALWQLFETCGAIEYVRVVRETKTQMGKGFGYVSFIDGGSVEAALALHGSKFRDRELRVFRYSGAKGQPGSAAPKGGPGGQAPPKDVAKVEKGEGAGPGWQQRERKRVLQRRQVKGAKGSKGSKDGKGGKGRAEAPKIKASAIDKQKKMLKQRKQVKLERKIKKRGGALVKKSKKAAAPQKPSKKGK